MLASSRVFTIAKIVVGFAVFAWALSYFGFSPSNYHHVLRKFKGEKAVFVADFLEHEIDSPFDGKPISDLCASRKWHPGRILTCDPPAGGIGEVRNMHLTCLRLAIESGAELVIPEVVRRNEKDISQLEPDSKGMPRGVPIDYFYDMNHLNRSLSTYCPQMKIHQSIHDLYDVPMSNAIYLDEHYILNPRVNNSVMKYPQNFTVNLERLLDHQFRKVSSRPKTLRLVVPRYWNFMWPTAFDPPEFVKVFGRILRFRTDTRRLAGAAVYSMQKRFDLALDPRQGLVRTKGFVGVHLRTEKDVWNKFPSYSKQAAYYLDWLMESKAPVAFLASGATSENVTAFVTRAKEFGVETVTKQDLLEQDDLDYLNSLTWDQQALVDYEIMLRAGLTTGPAESSFTWSLALRRAATTRPIVGGASEIEPEGNIRWQDHFSYIMGEKGKHDDMQLTIWP